MRMKKDSFGKNWGEGMDNRTRRDAKARFWIAFALLALFLITIPALHPMPVQAQTGPTPTPGGDSEPSEAPDRVEIEPTARDEEIRERLISIIEATGWFVEPQVEVREGVVFLTGQARTADYRRWAGDLARNTQDVVAVVNHL